MQNEKGNIDSWTIGLWSRGRNSVTWSSKAFQFEQEDMVDFKLITQWS